MNRIGSSHDFLALHKPLESIKLPPVNKKIAIVTSIKNEGISLLEWIAHYKILGVDSIVIYSNDNNDSSDELLYLLDSYGLIRWTVNTIPEHLSPQVKSFRHSMFYDDWTRSHQWVSFLDLDEFLYPKFEDKWIYNIPTYLDLIDQRFNPSAIFFHWKWFGGNKRFHRKNALISEIDRNSMDNNLGKMLFKCNEFIDLVDVHEVKTHSQKIVISSKLEERWERALYPNNYDHGQLNHYWQKSFQEFYIKKLRGDGASSRNFTLRDYDQFFSWQPSGGGDKSDAPNNLHLEKLKKFISDVRELPGITQAIKRVEDKFKSKTNHSGLIEEYIEYCKIYGTNPLI